MKKHALMIILLAVAIGLCVSVPQAKAGSIVVRIGPPPPPFPVVVGPPGVYVAPPGPYFYAPYYDDRPRWRHRHHRHHWRHRYHRHHWRHRHWR